jgi:hypothetical protein
MVVTDLIHPGMDDPDDPLLRWGMHAHEKGPSQTWWWLSPGVVTRMLWRLGFGRVDLLRHTQEYHDQHQRTTETQNYNLFTVVATRAAHRPTVPRKEQTATQRVRGKLARRIAGS